MINEDEALERIWEAVERRRGRRWAFPEISPKSTALVIVGLTRRLIGVSPRAQGAIAKIGWIAETMRATGGRVLWTRPAGDKLPAGLAAIQAGAPEAAMKDGDDFAPEFAPRHDDMILRTRLPSVFFPGSCSAPYLLRDAGIDTLVFAGGLTNVAVESSARDAVMSGFRVIVAADACAARSPAEHMASIAALHRDFADVRLTHDLTQILRRGSALRMSEVDAEIEAVVQAASFPGAPDLTPPDVKGAPLSADYEAVFTGAVDARAGGSYIKSDKPSQDFDKP